MTAEQEGAVDRLLHDAEHADSGAGMAGLMRDVESRRRLLAKRDRLEAEAHALDPEHAAPSWRECNPDILRRLAVPPVDAETTEGGR